VAPTRLRCQRHGSARYAIGGAQAIVARGGPLCQQAASRPAAAGTAGKVIGCTEAQLSKPCLRGATGPNTFDCSGLATVAYRATRS
jgi:cell wall-associated NlpC family hydrolase